jgi:hypothetical protein
VIGAGQLLFVLNRLRRSHTDRSVKPCRYATRTKPLEVALLERWPTPQTGFRELTDLLLAEVQAAAGAETSAHATVRAENARGMSG